MCEIHLVETTRAMRAVDEPERCSFCDEMILDIAVEISGYEANGSPGRLRFIYHPDCPFEMGQDREVVAGNDGCFGHVAEEPIANGRSSASRFLGVALNTAA